MISPVLRMLHALHTPRQARRAALLASVCAASLLAPLQQASGARSDEINRASELALAQRHAEAAAAYEHLAKRTLRGRDQRMLLLAAREYLAAGQLDDAGRLLDAAGEDFDGDDAILAVRTRAELLLARDDAEGARVALQALPADLPPTLNVELLALRARAQFGSGRSLEGVRTLEQRARLLATQEERDANSRMLLDALARPASGINPEVPPEATDDERAWFEVARVNGLAAGDAAAAATLADDLRRRHPVHPAIAYLPAATPQGPTLPGGPVAKVALLLPLTGRQQSVGEVVRDGFLAAALADEAELRPAIAVYDTAAPGVAAAYARALADGAQFVVGPLLREDLGRLVAATQIAVPTLALNALPGVAPPFLYQFALDPEQEARQVARRIAVDGHTRGIALFPRNAWGQRLHDAFTSEATASGLVLSAVQFFDPASPDFSGPLRLALGRFAGAGDREDRPGAPKRRRDAVAEAGAGPQFAFIAAANPKLARTIVPQLRFQMVYEVPVYATSDAWDPSLRAVADLDGMTHPEMPWVLYSGQGAPELWDALHSKWSGAEPGRMRLYAFGFDAFRLMGEFRSASTLIGMNGLTGNLSVRADGRVDRDTDWARIEGGRLQPAAAGPPVATPRGP